MPTNYVTILDSVGATVKVACEDEGASLFIQGVKLYKGPVGTPTTVDLPTPLPVMDGLQLVSDFSEATFSTSASGDTAVVTASGILVIYVWAFEIQNQGDPVAVKWRSNTTTLPPAILLPQYGSWSKDPMGRPWFKSAAGEALNINLSVATGPVVGKVWYTQS